MGTRYRVHAGGPKGLNDSRTMILPDIHEHHKAGKVLGIGNTPMDSMECRVMRMSARTEEQPVLGDIDAPPVSPMYPAVETETMTYWSFRTLL